MELSNTFTVDSPIDVTWPVLCDIERIAPCMPGAQLTEVDGAVFKGEVKIKVGPIGAKFKGTAEMTERDDDAHRAVLKAKGKDTGGKGNANATITASAEAAGAGTRVTIATDLSITGKVAQFGRGALDDVSTKLLGQFVDCLETRVLAGEDPADGGDAGGDDARGPGDSSAPDPAPVASGNGSSPQAAAGAGSPVATAPTPPPGGMPAGTVATGGEAAAGTSGASTATSSTPARAGDAASASAGSAGAATSSGPRKIESAAADPIDLIDAAGGAEAAKKAAGPAAAVMAVFFVIWWWRRRK